MEHFAGLDVSVKETSVCIVDDTGKIVREVKVVSEPKRYWRCWRNPPTTLSELGWKLDRYRNGCSVRSSKQACR